MNTFGLKEMLMRQMAAKLAGDGMPAEDVKRAVAALSNSLAVSQPAQITNKKGYA
jgi:hypothetical protein